MVVADWITAESMIVGGSIAKSFAVPDSGGHSVGPACHVTEEILILSHQRMHQKKIEPNGVGLNRVGESASLLPSVSRLQGGCEGSER